MTNPRASNPSGAKLLDQSTAHPGSIDKSIFEKKTGPAAGSSVGQGSVNPNYLKECREDNPEPASSAASQDQVALSNCRFLTPTEELRCDEKFEMAVDAKVTGSANLENVTFRLYSFLTKDGKEERSKVHTWLGSGKSVDPKADPVVVKATGKLVYEMGTDLSKPIPFEIEAKYCQQEPAKSPRVEVANKSVAHWIGGDDLHFATDGEFPLLGADGGLIQVLSAAVKRFEKPVEKGETTICFGFASSAGDADANRKLSLRRAKVVKAILDRDENAWNELAKANFGTSDIQQFLADLHAACGWECDPGAVDGQAGPKTKEAVASFQRECNSRYDLGLKEDGICGPRTWSAVLRAILGQVQAALGQDANKAPSWPKAKWGNAGTGVYGNGEDFATGGDKPQERSVQITFFLIGAEPRLEDPKPGQKATIKDNPVQDEKLVEKKKIEDRKPEAGKTSGSKSATVDCVCVIRCPELPGATTFKELHGLWVHLIDDQGVVQCAMSRKGSLKDASDKSIKIKTSTTYGLFLSHQQETLSKSQIDEVKKFAIPVKGEVLSGKEAKIDIWSQGNFIICEPPLKTDAVKPFLAELPATYEVAYVGVNKKTKQRGIYSYPIIERPRKPERYRGGGVIPLVEWQTTAGMAYLTTKFHPESKRLKILLASPAKPADAYTSFNSLNSTGSHTFSGHHQYKGGLVDALSFAATTKNPTKLPTPQSACCLPGDIIWQNQYDTNHCGAYSFSAVMNYWHPELPKNLGEDWAKKISSIVPFFNNAARVPGHLVEAASKNNLKCWLIDEDSVSTEAAALKTLKLWIQAGVPVIVLVNEAPGEFGLHWKTVVGYDQNRIFFNNSGGDMDHGRPITSTPDYFHAPVGNDVDSTEDFLMKWREASVPLVASKYTMLPMIPTALGYRGRESR